MPAAAIWNPRDVPVALVADHLVPDSNGIRPSDHELERGPSRVGWMEPVTFLCAFPSFCLLDEYVMHNMHCISGDRLPLAFVPHMTAMPQGCPVPAAPWLIARTAVEPVASDSIASTWTIDGDHATVETC